MIRKYIPAIESASVTGRARSNGCLTAQTHSNSLRQKTSTYGPLKSQRNLVSPDKCYNMITRRSQ